MKKIIKLVGGPSNAIRKGSPKKGKKVGLSLDVHTFIFKGSIKATSCFMEGSDNIDISISAKRGLALGLGLPDASPIGADIEGNRSRENVFKCKFNKKTGNFNSFRKDKNLAYNGELALNGSIGFLVEGSTGYDVKINKARREIQVDEYFGVAGGGHLPFNGGQAIAKLGIEAKGDVYYRNFTRHTFIY